MGEWIQPSVDLFGSSTELQNNIGEAEKKLLGSVLVPWQQNVSVIRSWHGRRRLRATEMKSSPLLFKQYCNILNLNSSFNKTAFISIKAFSIGKVRFIKEECSFQLNFTLFRRLTLWTFFITSCCLSKQILAQSQRLRH